MVRYIETEIPYDVKKKFLPNGFPENGVETTSEGDHSNGQYGHVLKYGNHGYMHSMSVHQKTVCCGCMIPWETDWMGCPYIAVHFMHKELSTLSEMPLELNCAGKEHQQ